MIRGLLIGLSLLIPSTAVSQGEQRFADLGECRLQNGQAILDCRIGYRTWGQLNEDRSNAVLFPSWFTGTSGQLATYVGPDRFVDPGEFYVIAVDALGNGVSSSPSNSPRQEGEAFPEFTIRDMIQTQHRLLQEELGIEHLRAVMGISMGGMQTFEWIVSHPEFMDRAVPIVGSPQLTGYDLILWEAQLRTIEQCLAAGCEDPGLLIRLMSELIVSTPQQQNRDLLREEIDETIEGLRESADNPFTPLDYASQLRAMLTHDVSKGLDGDMAAAAGRVQADLLAVVATFDHGVTPEAARTFTSLAGGTLLELDSECGHVVFSCERPLIGHAVRGFLMEENAARR